MWCCFFTLTSINWKFFGFGSRDKNRSIYTTHHTPKMDPSLIDRIQATCDHFSVVLLWVDNYFRTAQATSRRAQKQIPSSPTFNDWEVLQRSLAVWANRELTAAGKRGREREYRQALGLSGGNHPSARSSLGTHPALRGEEEEGGSVGEVPADEDDGSWMERATDKKIEKTLYAIDWALFEIDTIVKQAIDALNLIPSPVRIRFRDPFASSSSPANGHSHGEPPSAAAPMSPKGTPAETRVDGRTPRTAEYEARKGIPNDRTPHMVEHEANIMRNAWIRLKSQYGFIESRHLVDLNAYSDMREEHDNKWFVADYVIKGAAGLKNAANAANAAKAGNGAEAAAADAKAAATMTTTTTYSGSGSGSIGASEKPWKRRKAKRVCLGMNRISKDRSGW